MKFSLILSALTTLSLIKFSGSQPVDVEGAELKKRQWDWNNQWNNNGANQWGGNNDWNNQQQNNQWG
eukprot:jgi/Orpsp1_1/1179886/evm.model.c7180000071199.1